MGLQSHGFLSQGKSRRILGKSLRGVAVDVSGKLIEDYDFCEATLRLGALLMQLALHSLLHQAKEARLDQRIESRVNCPPHFRGRFLEPELDDFLVHACAFGYVPMIKFISWNVGLINR